MAAKNEVRSGYVYGYDIGDDYSSGIETTLKILLATTLGGGVLDRDLTAPPGLPDEGDAYIVGDSATGDWSGLADQVVIYNGAGWDAYQPADGFHVFILDESVLSVYVSGLGWSDGTAHSWS